MKYRFITIMHNMKLKTVKNRGISLFPGARLSNGSIILKETLQTNLMQGTAGVHSLDEFIDTVYFYMDNELKEIETKEEMDKIGIQYTFFLLRILQNFLNPLWEIKDNNVYIRDGFLIVYDKTFEDGFTYKASLSPIFTRSTLDREKSIFSDEELKLAIDRFDVKNVEDYYLDGVNYIYSTDDLFLSIVNQKECNELIILY